MMAQTLPGGYGTIDTRMLGQTLGATGIGAPGSPMMSRFQLSTVDVGGEVEKEFRDNRAFFQRTGKWACPVCFWATNTGFSQVRIVVGWLFWLLLHVFPYESSSDLNFFSCFLFFPFFFFSCRDVKCAIAQILTMPRRRGKT
jgi:hypothetical protein